MLGKYIKIKTLREEWLLKKCDEQNATKVFGNDISKLKIGFGIHEMVKVKTKSK